MVGNAQEAPAGANSAGPADREPSTSLRQALVGSWALVSWAETSIATGEVLLPLGDAPRGFLLYTDDGYMSAQISSPNRGKFAVGHMYRGTPEEYTAAGKTYMAYSGAYHVDEARRTVEHGMAVSLFPNWTGDRQLRMVDLDGDVLRLSIESQTMFDGNVKTTTVTWHRAAVNI